MNKSKIKEIVREHNAQRLTEEILNEGIMDFLKMIGEKAMGAFKAAKGVSDEWDNALNSEIETLGVDSGETEKLVQQYVNNLRGGKKEILNFLIKDAKDIAGIEDDEEAKRFAVAVFNTAWARIGSEN